MGERGGDLVEREDAVDVDLDLAGDAQVGQRLEVGRPLLHDEHPDRAAGEPARPTAADGEHAQQRAHRPADAPVRAAGCERAPVGEDRPVRDQVQDQVVRLGRSG